MKAMLVGFGEVGRAVYEVFSQAHDIRIVDPAQGHVWAAEYGKQDLILVCIPWSVQFHTIVKEYRAFAGTDTTLIFSTVPIGTCRYLKASHFPVEGRHPAIAQDMRRCRNIVGGVDHMVRAFLLDSRLSFEFCDKPEMTEFLKLRSLAYYGLLIEFARLSKAITDEIDMSFALVQDYDRRYNELVVSRGTPDQARSILDPPEGPIGGHCVLPGVRLLSIQHPDPLLDAIIQANKRIAREGSDEPV